MASWRTSPAPWPTSAPEEGRAISERFVDVLRSIHEVDIDAVGLGDAAKRTGYLERQVTRWTDQWHRAKESDVPVIDELAVRLHDRLPPSGPATIVHGDYRLGNVMIADPGTDIVGVFDWEMATLGDPLADVGYTLLWWGTSDRPPINPSQLVADLPGFLTTDELLARYGADPDVVTFHLVLAAFKLTIIGEGNRARCEAPRPGDARLPLRAATGRLGPRPIRRPLTPARPSAPGPARALRISVRFVRRTATRSRRRALRGLTRVR